MTDIQKEYCEEKGLIYINPENTEIADYINWLEVQIQALRIHDVSGMLPDDVPNLFVTLAQQIHYESVINGLNMTGITECFNELQEAYKKERSNYR